MKTCDAWLNGKCVGKVQIHDDGHRADIRCDLPDGWIYRAVLFLHGKELGRFGVLLPQDGAFSTTLLLADADCYEGALHCEVLRNRPGEQPIDGAWLALDQCSPWNISAFPLDQTVLELIKKKNGVQYRIYNQKRYLLFPADVTKADPLAALFCVGRMLTLQKRQFLCIAVDMTGEIIPWEEDEN